MRLYYDVRFTLNIKTRIEPALCLLLLALAGLLAPRRFLDPLHLVNPGWIVSFLVFIVALDLIRRLAASYGLAITPAGLERLIRYALLAMPLNPKLSLLFVLAAAGLVATQWLIPSFWKNIPASFRTDPQYREPPLQILPRLLTLLGLTLGPASVTLSYIHFYHSGLWLSAIILSGCSGDILVIALANLSRTSLPLSQAVGTLMLVFVLRTLIGTCYEKARTHG